MRATFTRIVILFLIGVVGLQFPSFAQTGVLNPNDSIVVYNPSAPPVAPPNGTLVKWVKSNRLNWNTSEFKCYFYNGVAFRLKFPKSYTTAQDGKTYPLYVFFHGVGEAGNIYDNEYQLYHGGQPHVNNVDNGNFDGFLLYPQSSSPSGGWGAAQFGMIQSLIQNYLIPQVKVDMNRVIVEGLSGGGGGAWDFTFANLTLPAAVLPISAASVAQTSYVNQLKFTPIWLFQGGKDTSPDTTLANTVKNAYLGAGSNFTYTLFVTQGHDAWDSAWLMPNYYNFLNLANKANPWPLHGRLQYCPGDVISDTLGVDPGLGGYQWRLNGNPISGATNNTYIATGLGVYDVRIMNNGVWSAYSPIPDTISLKGATVSPNIAVYGLASKVLPAPDGSTGVSLQVPAGYTSYVWERVDSPAILSATGNILTGATAGSYAVKVTELFGCSSSFSTPFVVAKAGGVNPPSAATSLNVTALSQTTAKLSWSENPSPANPETAFEVYQGSASGGPYKLIGFAPAKVDTFVATGLNAKTTYWFEVRAIDSSAAAAVTAPASVLTLADTVAPSAPSGLTAVSTGRTYVVLSWTAATDNVGVTNYDIYVNGQKSYSIGNQTVDTIFNLTEKQFYTFAVKARDLAGNVSPFSNQIAAAAAFSGLNYNYYQGTWNSLPNFSSLTPFTSGIVPNVTLSNALSDVDYGFTWTGTINVPVSGTYQFQTSSDDGSALFIDVPYSATATPTVNNDGLHGTVTVTSSSLTLAAGPHTFVATYFQNGGGVAMTVQWKGPQTGGQFVAIPDSAFVEMVTSAGNPPNPPTGLSATATGPTSVNLAWTNGGTGQQATEVYRSTAVTGPFVTVGRSTGAGTTFKDSTVQSATTYYYEVKAINQYGSSKFNGQDSAALTYNYYETGSLSVLPNFATLTPTSTGLTNTFGVQIPNRGVQWAATYTGYIQIATAGNYTFYTSSDDGSALYIDGNRIVNNDGLHATQEASGNVTLTAGLHNIQVQFFQNGGGQVLTASYAGPGISKQVIPTSILGKPPISVTTPSLPGAPSTPTSFAVAVAGSKRILVSWKDSATVATSYNLYRSAGNTSSFGLLTTLPAGNGAFGFADSSVFPNATYYYKLNAANSGGLSNFTPVLSATTLDSLPAIAPVGNKSMRYGTTLALPIVVTSPVGDQLSVVFGGVPAFGSVVSTGNGTATLTFNPQQTDSGTYTITITATDQHGGVSHASFPLWVNNIYNPVISGITNVTYAEGTTDTLKLTAVDQNPGDSVRWRFSGLPSFVTPVISAGTVNLVSKPGFAAQGTYNVSAIAYGGVGGSDSEHYTITVTYLNPNKTYFVSFNAGTKLAPAPWNNTAKATPALNDIYGPLKDSTGVVSALNLHVTSNWAGIGTGSNASGVNTGNNSGVYPDVVISQAYWSTTLAQSFDITGLDTSHNRTYTLTFFGSRGQQTDNRLTNYTVGTTTVSLQASSNSQNTVSISGIRPNASGIISVTIKNGTGSVYSYINAMVIHNIFNDSTAPATPINFAAVMNAAGTVANLTWTPIAYNETNYQVYRSASATGPFTLVGTTPAKASGYNDSTVVGNATYYYEVNAINSIGVSGYTPVVQVAVPNKPPVLTRIANPTTKGDSSITVSLAATYTPGDQITLTAQNLPSFATLTDNGSGHGTLVISPTNSQAGTYKGVILTAKDNFGGVNSDTVTIIVKDKNLVSTYIDFNATLPVGAPWNCLNANPLANTTIANLKDENSLATGVGISLLETWGGASAVGALTGNNSGVYPDSVEETAYFDNSGQARHIKLTGLSSTQRYNLVFFASRVASDTRITYFSVGTDTVSLNCSNNTNNTVQLNGLAPDNTGAITVSINKASAAPYAYINAMVIQSYAASNTPLAPANLVAQATGKTKAVLHWSDQSNNETGFEIWRADVANGSNTLIDSMQLIDTVAANVTSYTDQSLAAASSYAYEVRAKAVTSTGNLYSDYSNMSYTATLIYSVYINFNRTNPASAPWNNTNTVPNPGAVFPDLNNDAGANTGMAMTIVNNFSGDNPYGVNTGNNSGVYPDNVIDKTWWTDASTTATLQISGLNQAQSYNFVFFASRTATDNADRTTVYSIGSKSATLNATNDTSVTTQINGVTPDGNGNVTINIVRGVNSSYGYIGALVIQATNSFSAPVVNTGNATTTSFSNRVSFQDSLVNNVTLFPNPFTDDVHMSLTLSSAVEKLMVRIVGVDGRILAVRQLNSLPQGTSVQSLGINGGSLGAGVYFIQVVGLPDGVIRSFKMLKQ